jgi:hypothetical protein
MLALLVSLYTYLDALVIDHRSKRTGQLHKGDLGLISSHLSELGVGGDLLLLLLAGGEAADAICWLLLALGDLVWGVRRGPRTCP